MKWRCCHCGRSEETDKGALVVKCHCGAFMLESNEEMEKYFNNLKKRNKTKVRELCGGGE